MRPSVALAFVVTWIVAALFCAFSLFTVIAAARWAFINAPLHELLKMGGAWILSFILMQGWSYYLRHAPCPK